MMSINKDINNVFQGIKVLNFEIGRALDEGRADKETVNVNIRQLW